MIWENIQGNQFIIVVPRVLHYLKLYEQQIDTMWPFNTSQDNTKSPGWTLQMVTTNA